MRRRTLKTERERLGERLRVRNKSKGRKNNRKSKGRCPKLNLSASLIDFKTEKKALGLQFVSWRGGSWRSILLRGPITNSLIAKSNCEEGEGGIFGSVLVWQSYLQRRRIEQREKGAPWSDLTRYDNGEWTTRRKDIDHSTRFFTAALWPRPK